MHLTERKKKGGSRRKGSGEYVAHEQRRPLLPPSLKNSRYPWLIYCHGRTRKKTFATVLPRPSFGKVPQLYGEEVVRSYPEGWLLLFNDSSKHYALCNPSLELIKYLPSTPPELKITGSRGKRICHEYALLLSPSSSSSSSSRGGGGGVLFLIFDTNNPIIFCCRFTAGSSSCPRQQEYDYDYDDDDDDANNMHWTLIRYRKHMEDFNIRYPPPNLHDDAASVCHKILPLVSCSSGGGSRLYAYAPNNNYKLLLVDIVELPGCNHYDIAITPTGCDAFPHPPIRTIGFRLHFLDCDGHLLMVYFTLCGPEFGDILAVHVKKLNISPGTPATWEEVEASGICKDKCLFVDDDQYLGAGYGSGFCLSNVPESEGNRVYFLRSECKYLFCYNIGDNSCSVSLPCLNLPTPWRTPMWVTPTPYEQHEDEIRDNPPCGRGCAHGLGGGGAAADAEDKEQEHVLLLHDHVNRGICLFDHIDVLDVIASKLIPIDYFNFRASCRMSRLLLPPKRRRTALQQQDDSKSLSACLMFPTGGNMWDFVVPREGGRYMLTSPESWQYPTIRCSKDGWLLFSYSEKMDSMALFNPFTKSLIPLPNLKDEPWICFTFLSSPLSEDHLVVGISDMNIIPRVAILKQGYGAWTIQSFPMEPDFRLSYSSPVFYRGGFYLLGKAGNLVVVRQKTSDNWEWKLLDRPRPPPCDGSFSQNFIVECGGELMAVFVGFMGSKVDIFKLKNMGEEDGGEWQRVESLGQYVLYLSMSSSFSVVAGIREMENRIYFPRVHQGSLVFYSLETSRFYCEGREETLKHGFCDTEEKLLCAWIEPNWRM